MTEDEWVRCEPPRPMLNFIRVGCSDRKMRLFACACCRASLLSEHDPGLADMVRLFEGYADGVVRLDELPRKSRFFPQAAVTPLRSKHAFSAACKVVKHIAMYTTRPFELGHSDLLRDIFGNPFRPVAADPRWLTSTVVALADAIYAGRAFDRLPVLADALEEAGCDNSDMLAHCRSDGPHARGCWVVDLVLGKS